MLSMLSSIFAIDLPCLWSGMRINTPAPALCSTGPYGIRSASAEAIVALDFIHTRVP